MRSKLMLTMLFLGSALLRTTGARAQTATAPLPQFDMIGFIQEASLDTAGAICTPAAPALAGGTLTINGIQMIVPCNTILQFPANSTTWAQLFDPAVSAPLNQITSLLPPGPPAPPPPTHGPPPGALGPTALALADGLAPFPSFEAHVQGNVLTDPVTGAPRYIVGLIVPISQEINNAGAGSVSYIDYAFGTLRVGGIPNDPSCSALAPGGGASCSGSLVQFNDPVGRYGLAHSPDPRFTSDTNNPTIHAATGIPVCIPRVAPPAVDALCPQGNRPLNGDPNFPTSPFLPLGAPLTQFDMPPPVNGQFPDARQQVPLEVGDWIIFSGTLVKIDPLGANTRANTYISANTVNANLGIFTAPGVPPAYVFVDSFLIGTGGNPIAGIPQENTTRLFLSGFTTDPTRFVDINAVDVNPCTGVEKLRHLVTADPATQPVRGRFVERLLGGFFMPPTREYMAVSHTGTLPNMANGLVAGQYRLPNFGFVFPEHLKLGDPVLPGNFQDMPFLSHGSGPLFGSGTVVGQLAPWPGSPGTKAAVCTANGTAPIVGAGANLGAISGSLVTLAGNATLDPNSSGTVISWAQTLGPPVILANANTLNPSFTAPTVLAGSTALLTFKLTVTDQFGSDFALVTVTVTPQTDTVAFVTATWKIGGAGVKTIQKVGKLTVTATSSSPTVTMTIDDVLASNTTIQPLGALTAVVSPPGTFTFTATSVPQPSKLVLHSSGGGSATAVCGQPSVTGVVTCQ